MNVDDKTYQRFMSKVSKDPCGCWIWKASKNKDGYGQFSVKNKVLSAHRFSYEIHKGPVSKGLSVCHSCDNPSCVNPDHLWIGTHKDNMKDCWQKNRGKTIFGIGQKNVKAKLTEENAQEIKNSDLKYLELAEKFNVTRETISKIKRNKRWAHI